jgi:UrcA family protein
MRATIFALSSLTLLATTNAALAAPPQSTPPGLSVRYADLNLKDARDAATMLKRIHKAAAAVCTTGPLLEGNDSDTIRRVDDCMRQAVSRAVDGLNAPLVTQVYAGKRTDPVMARVP